MDFEIRHRFGAPVAAVGAALLDPAFQDSLRDLDALADRKVLSQETAPSGVTVRRVRCVLDIDLGAARRFVGDGDPAWVERATWDPETATWGWEVEPEIGGDLLSASGTVELTEASEGTERRVAGGVKVRVPLYGSRVERWIVEGLRRAYDEEAERLSAWLESGVTRS